MSTSLRPPRILDAAFEGDLVAGPLAPLLTLVQRDRDLIAEIRTDILDVYCKGQRLVSVKRLRDGYRLLSHEKFWGIQSLDVQVAEQVAAFCETEVPHIKQRIALHAARGKEIEFEQLLVRVNNREGLNSDYIAVDRQGIAEEGKGRTDVVGVYWPGDRRITNDALMPALIEVKFGLGGGVEGVAAQLSRYFEDLRGTLPTFAHELQGQLRQKARLGLLNGLSDLAQAKIQRLPVSDRIEDVRAVVALVDYNPRAGRLDLGALRALPFADQIDLFHLGFGLWRANSAFRAEPQVAVKEGWIDAVQGGRFDAIPNPFHWNDSIELMDLLDGYEVAREIGITKLSAFANAKLSHAEATGCWPGTALELWLCLFFEHRRARHSGEPEEYAEGPHPVRDALCQSLRDALQRLSDHERSDLTGWLAKHRAGGAAD
ncbi:hypothetical protein [Methylobacterium radiodurans]|uniref:hypothetical protein n=1 Tax=Methylobacterium radiodurans TaxID=2202828 RepID=UPI0013A52DA7|nr:hypothetical protein [Methylobacterium radiodurans]